MAQQFRPSLPFNVPLKLLIPTYTTVNGVKTKTFPTIANGILFYGTFKTYGGSETTINGIYAIEDTATIETWFRPDILSNCRIANANTNAIYEILGEPENIEMKNQFLVFKVLRVKGGV